MTTVIGVRFKKAGKVYYFDPSGVWPNPGDQVVVETARGIELGEVIAGAREVEDDQIVAPLKEVIRIATPEDVHRAEYNQSREKEAHHICQDRIEQHKLEMKLVDVEYTFDGSKIIFYFTANGRVDFRELVKDLASVFKMRIELRQIGVRDEAKMLGGLGSCGRPICCGTFLGDFQPVSIKMAKEQNLSLNPTKISGQCGRLMCCLKYEQDYYETSLKRLPRVGREGLTPDGVGIIVDINVIREKVRVRFRDADGNFDVREYPLEEVSKLQQTQQPSDGGAAKTEKSAEPRPPRARKPKPPRDKEGKEGKEGKERDPKEKDAQPKEGTRERRPRDKGEPAQAGANKPAEKDEKAEKPAKRRPPRIKGPKQRNADAYFNKLNEASPAASPSGAAAVPNSKAESAAEPAREEPVPK